ncbi:MAG TPA: TolC family protein, partial [Steroidobacteraceae bacterium]|nr:TolC family protein [Steroidobacteraceae bacterium]
MRAVTSPFLFPPVFTALPVTLAFALAVLLTGCVSTPYRRPTLPTPTAWRATDDTASVAWPSEDWWKGFQSTRLDELITDASKANDDLAASIARVREADAQARIAGAPLWPSLDLNAQGTRERVSPSANPSTSNLPTANRPRTGDDFNVGLGAAYELDFWGKNRALHAAALAEANASRYDRATIELSVMTSVATTYFQALELRERLSVAQQNLATAQQLL